MSRAIQDSKHCGSQKEHKIIPLLFNRGNSCYPAVFDTTVSTIIRTSDIPQIIQLRVIVCSSRLSFLFLS